MTGLAPADKAEEPQQSVWMDTVLVPRNAKKEALAAKIEVLTQREASRYGDLQPLSLTDSNPGLRTSSVRLL